MTAVCLQVRLDSHRLPEKALLKIEDLTIIEHAMRALSSVNADLFLLLTTEECVSRLQTYAEKWGFTVFSGPKENVLKRFILAADSFGIQTVIRATGDNPLVSAEMANEVLEEHRRLKADYSNWFDAPLGTGIEVVESSALLMASTKTDDPYDLEHVTPWIYNNPLLFNLNIHRVPEKYCFVSKVSVDTQEDYERMKHIFSILYHNGPISVKELIKFLKEKILLIPSADKGNGTGHIKRMLSLCRTLNGNLFLYIRKSDEKRLASLLTERGDFQIVHQLENLKQFRKIIVDTRAIPEEFYEKHLKGLNLIAIDEGGPLREKIPYLIDVLPLPRSYSEANVRSLGFLDLPEKKSNEKNDKILVTFGGEDPAGLTEIFCSEMLSEHPRKIPVIDLVLGPLYKGPEPDSRFNIIRSPSSLHEILPNYSGVVTSFGITAYEANSLDIPVLLVNPSEYHQELGEISGFTSSGIKTIDTKIFECFLSKPDSVKLIEMEEPLDDLGEFINNLDNVAAQCPVCSTVDFTVIQRFNSRSYCRCDKCQIVFMLNYSRKKTVYDKEYFFNQYEKQYGKTYLDDFEHIGKLAQSRIDIIKRKSCEGGTILDVGCAYGPFLKTAAENGYKPYGTDISSEAVAYVCEKLHYPAECSEFYNFSPPADWFIHKFDIISMWYVIEHFSDLSQVLKKVNSLLETGGLFTFSTPSGSGISSRKNISDFLFNSPEDHYTIWEPEKSKGILELFGFRVIKRRITGHHPERFNSFLINSKLGRKILKLYSHWFGLGDTFEIYAVKVREL